MQIQKEKCDQCRLEVEDYYTHLGWIKIRIDALTVSKGRDKKGVAVTNFLPTKTLDFCSEKCFNSYFGKLIKLFVKSRPASFRKRSKEKKNAPKANSRSKSKKMAS